MYYQSGWILFFFRNREHENKVEGQYLSTLWGSKASFPKNHFHCTPLQRLNTKSAYFHGNRRNISCQYSLTLTIPKERLLIWWHESQSIHLLYIQRRWHHIGTVFWRSLLQRKTFWIPLGPHCSFWLSLSFSTPKKIHFTWCKKKVSTLKMHCFMVIGEISAVNNNNLWRFP